MTSMIKQINLIKWLKISLLGLFFTTIFGGVIGTVIGLRTARDMAIGAEIESEFASIKATELTIIPTLDSLNSVGDYDVKSNGKWGLMGIDKDHITLHGIHVKYVKSSDSLFHITKNITSRSHSHQQGVIKCQNIQHKMQLKNDTLNIESAYRFPKEDKLRNQEIYVTIEIPENGKVYINNRVVQFEQVDYEDEELNHYIEQGLIRGNGTYQKQTFYID